MKLLSILTLFAITVLGGGCAVARNPVGPAVETPTRQPAPVVQVDIPEAVVEPEPAPAVAAPPIVDGVPYTCEFHENACSTTEPPPPAEPGWVYRDCEEQGLVSAPTGCVEGSGNAPPGTPIRD